MPNRSMKRQQRQWAQAREIGIDIDQNGCALAYQTLFEALSGKEGIDDSCLAYLRVRYFSEGGIQNGISSPSPPKNPASDPSRLPSG